MEAVEAARKPNVDGYNAVREFLPYYFEEASLAVFRSHFDAQTLKQELAYLLEPAAFSLVGKLKSLPWRLAIAIAELESHSRHN